MNRIVLLILLLLLGSCSCHSRIERLQKKCPQCFELQHLTDTVVLKAIEYDTVLISHSHCDTFLIASPRAEVQIIKEVDTLYTTLHLKPDTIYRTLHLPAPRTTQEPRHTTPLSKVASCLRPAVWVVPFIIILLIYIRRIKK